MSMHHTLGKSKVLVLLISAFFVVPLTTQADHYRADSHHVQGEYRHHDRYHKHKNIHRRHGHHRGFHRYCGHNNGHHHYNGYHHQHRRHAHRKLRKLLHFGHHFMITRCIFAQCLPWATVQCGFLSRINTHFFVSLPCYGYKSSPAFTGRAFEAPQPASHPIFRPAIAFGCSKSRPAILSEFWIKLARCTHDLNHLQSAW